MLVQYDVYGELLGLLGAHPVAPLVSIHHVDVVWPIYPGMSRVKALQHLLQSVKLDSASIMQQSIYYDRQRMVLVHFGLMGLCGSNLKSDLS